MKESLIKPFTITSLGLCICLVGTKVFQHFEKKQKADTVNAELNRLHEVQLAEIKKNGKTSDETKESIANIINNLK